MSDMGNLYGSYEDGERYLREQHYAMAAEEFWWCDRYFENGEFHSINKDMEDMGNSAGVKWREIMRKLPFLSMTRLRYKQGCQCLKGLWLHENKSELRKTKGGISQTYYEEHTALTNLVKELFDSDWSFSPQRMRALRRKSIRAKTPFRIPALPYKIATNVLAEETAVYLKSQEFSHIFDATFAYKNMFSMITVLDTENGLNKACVFTREEVSDDLLNGYAFDYFVISHNVPLSDFVLFQVNDDYLKTIGVPIKELTSQNADIQKLFVKKSILPEVLERQVNMDDRIKMMGDITRKRIIPSVPMGKQCHEPSECDFVDYCVKTNLLGLPPIVHK